MRTGRWRTWLGVGILAVLGVSRAPAQVISTSPTSTYGTTGLPAQPRPVTIVTDSALPLAPPVANPPPPPPPPGTAPGFHMPVAMPIDAPAEGHHGGHSEAGHEAAHEASHAGTGEACDPGGLAFWGEYLLMKPHRNAQDYAIIAPDRITLPGGTIQSVDLATQSGFRFGGGWKLPGEGWLIGVTYTYLHTNDNQTIGAPGNGDLFATLTRSGPVMDAALATASCNLDYNVIDIEASKRFSPSHGLDLTVFGGGRVAIIDQKLDATYSGGAGAVGNDHVSSPVYFYGFGPTFGMQSDFRIYEGHEHTGLSLYARARGSLISGEFRNFLTENIDNTPTIVNVNEKTHSVVPVLDLGVGVAMEWEHLSVSVGYELTNWFGMVNSPDFTDTQNLGKVSRRTSDLSLEGLAVRVGLSF